jgi:flagellar L-ring protein precursor FlgH
VRRILFALLLTGCGVAHIEPYKPKERDYPVPVSPAVSSEEAASGSLWRSDARAAMLFTDARAFRLNDLVVVRVEEIADAHRNADTSTRRDTELTLAVQAFLKAANVTSPQVDLTASGTSGTHFDASGSTDRTEHLTATVPSIVRKVLPNGNLFIEGHRVVLVNQEEQHFYISGVVRPIDIAGDNSIRSSSLADAEIEFTGRGVLTDNQKQGLIARFFSWIWPF